MIKKRPIPCYATLTSTTSSCSPKEEKRGRGKSQSRSRSSCPSLFRTGPNGRDSTSSSSNKVSLLGIGGKKKKSEDGAAKNGTKKRSPGEIRIQKDIAELDGGKVANMTSPTPTTSPSLKYPSHPIRLLEKRHIQIQIRNTRSLPTHTTQSPLRYQNLPPEYQSRGESLSKHSERGLEARVGYQCGDLWAYIFIL
ncbi:ubiquitin-conjugating enzyme family [Skeletonema marinoi]|uniref:Ubiquitin-conjugating enzyme family n=1 Tax=Skeletonema marinoi TaxID=267567 RepID=A0AAD8XRE0_9STRA|nr:ubiquitin-conjugating enzyme family [Skeletonema marinoi]